MPDTHQHPVKPLARLLLTHLALAATLLLASLASAQSRLLAPLLPQQTKPNAVTENGATDRLLEVGQPIEQEMKGGEMHSYRVALSAGQYMHAVIDQRGIDIVVTLLAPDGRKIAEIDSPNSTQGPEPVSIVADMTGSYRIEVRSLDKNAPTGRYEARVVELRAATAQDKNRVAAERTFAAATLLTNNGTAELQQQAINKYEEALPLWRAIEDRASEAATLRIIASTYTALKQYAKSLNSYNQLLALDRALGDRQGEADTLSNIGTAYGLSGNYQQALNAYNQVLPLYRALGDRSGEAQTLSNIGSAYAWLGDRQKSIEYDLQALLLYQALGDRSGESSMLNKIGEDYKAIDNYQKSLEYYNQALSLKRAIGDHAGEATALVWIGANYISLAEYQQALNSLTQAMALYRSLGDRQGETNALLGIGRVNLDLDEYQKALDIDLQATKIAHETGDRVGEGVGLNNLGATYSYLGNQRQALAYFTQALTFKRAMGDRDGEADVLNALGWAHYNLGEYQEALAYYNQAIPIYRAIGDKAGEATTLSNIGRDYRDLKQPQRALEYLSQSLQMRQAIGDRDGEAIAHRNLGGIYTDLGAHQQAIDHLYRALEIARELKEPDREGQTLTSLMQAWKANNKPQLAIFYGKQAVNAFQAIRSNIGRLDKETQQNFLHSKEAAYRDLADLLVTQGRLTEAQQVLNLLKAQEYLDFIRRDGGEAAEQKSATLSPQEAAWRQRYDAVAEQLTVRGRERGELLAKKTRTPAEEQQLAKLESDLQLAGRAFQQYLDQLSDEFGNTKQAARVDQLRDSQGLMDDLRELGANSVALYTIVGEEKYRIILITPDVEKAAEYPIKATDLNRKVLAFREALQNRAQDPRPLAQELYKILVAPIAKDLRDAHAETLMWSLDGVLRYVPMAALYDGEHYMVENYRNVVFTPASNSRLKDLPSATWKGLGVGVSKAQPGFIALPGVPEELNGIIQEETRSKNGGGVLTGQVMLDERFTAENLKTALRKRYPVVHVASHFAVLPGNETNSFLLLGDGSHLTLGEIKSAQNLFSGVELLTLSACDTATGGTSAEGKEVESFAVLAQRQGAKAVIASLWPVADASTKLLMQNFYRMRNAQPGTLKVEALRQAQLSLLHGSEQNTGLVMQRGIGSEVQNTAKETKYAHPYYWAPFILIGNWR